MTGGLFDPLGADRADHARGAGRPPTSIAVAGLVLAGLAALLAVSWLRDDGDRGRPMALAPIEHVQAPPKASPFSSPPAQPSAASPASAPVPAATAGLPPVRDDQEVEVQNGVRIVRPRRERPATGSQTIRVPGAEAPR